MVVLSIRHKFERLYGGAFLPSEALVCMVVPSFRLKF